MAALAHFSAAIIRAAQSSYRIKRPRSCGASREQRTAHPADHIGAAWRKEAQAFSVARTFVPLTLKHPAHLFVARRNVRACGTEETAARCARWLKKPALAFDGVGGAVRTWRYLRTYELNRQHLRPLALRHALTASGAGSRRWNVSWLGCHSNTGKSHRYGDRVAATRRIEQLMAGRLARCSTTSPLPTTSFTPHADAARWRNAAGGAIFKQCFIELINAWRKTRWCHRRRHRCSSMTTVALRALLLLLYNAALKKRACVPRQNNVLYRCDCAAAACCLSGLTPLLALRCSAATEKGMEIAAALLAVRRFHAEGCAHCGWRKRNPTVPGWMVNEGGDRLRLVVDGFTGLCWAAAALALRAARLP